MRVDSKHIINYPWLFYTVANSDVSLSGREGETWFIQSGILFSFKKKGLGTTDWHLQVTAPLFSLVAGKHNPKERMLLNEH